MMRIPSASTPITWTDIRRGLSSFFTQSSYIAQFEEIICNIFAVKHCFAFNSGTAAFYIVLKALGHLSKKKEVILPAYTAPHLVLAIREAGLRPALCDVSASTFNLDIQRLSEVITKETLCIIPVHMFGIACETEPILRLAKLREIFVFEDSASALGTKLGGKKVGGIGDVSIYSFNRGKNMTTFSGGCVTTNSKDIAQALKKESSVLSRPSRLTVSLMPIKTIALSLAMRPLFYTLLFPLMSRFKHTELHSSFDVKLYTDFQAALGLSLLKRAESFFEIRQRNGLILYEGLKDIKDIILPRLIAGDKPVFNQFPVVFKQQILRDKFHKELIKKGIEATILYPEPIHVLYDLGYDKNVDPFPNATFIAKRILLLPTHPLVSKAKLKIMIKLLEQLNKT